MSIRLGALSYLRKTLAGASPPLRLVFWDGDVFDFVAEPTVVITFGSPRLWKALLRGDFSRLADAYVRGELKVEGDPQQIIKVGVRLSERLERAPASGLLKSIAGLVIRSRSPGQDAANVRRHYDVSNEFYKLWLDKRLVYSCGYFRNEADNIHLAQEQKLEHILTHSQTKPHDL